MGGYGIAMARTRPSRRPRVALAIPQGHPFVERVLGGIIAHAQERGGWDFARIGEARAHSSLWLRDWDGDGAFVWIADRAEERALSRLPFPVVNLASRIACRLVPGVSTDHRAIGRLAAEHLAERRFLHCAYVGLAGLWYSQERLAGFRAEVERRGGTCAVHLAAEPRTAAHGWRASSRRLDAWLRRLDRPVGILASSDLQAALVLDACARCRLAVPQEVAVLGVDDAVLTCSSCRPTLSSVSRNDHAVGLAAARLLERMMAGGEAPAGPLSIPPGPVTARQSTDTCVVGDALVAEALRWMDAHCAAPVGVADLVRDLGCSRRQVEARFRAELGQAPYRVMCQRRVERVRRLLAAPHRQRLSAVAAACGLGDVRHLREVFARHEGLSPQAFRERMQRAATSSGPAGGS